MHARARVPFPSPGCKNRTKHGTALCGKDFLDLRQHAARSAGLRHPVRCEDDEDRDRARAFLRTVSEQMAFRCRTSRTDARHLRPPRHSLTCRRTSPERMDGKERFENYPWTCSGHSVGTDENTVRILLLRAINSVIRRGVTPPVTSTAYEQPWIGLGGPDADFFT